MRSFSERNPVVIAVVGLVGIVAIGLLTFYSNQLPFLSSATTYTAEFHDASGLISGDDVRVAGVKVGSVDSISLSHTVVKVRFDVSGTWVGDQTTAAIKIKTLLGQEFLALAPAGSTKQNPHVTIPLSRTSTPIDVSEALSGLATTTGNIDTAQLASSFEALSQAFANTPPAVRASLQGLTALSQTISSRDAKLRELAANSADITTTLVENNAAVSSLITDGQQLLSELQARSQAITALLSGTQAFATQLAGLVKDNQSTLGPALKQLSAVTAVLTANKANLQKALQLLGPYYSMLTDATGSGHWLDVYICGLFDASGAPQLNATATRDCTPGGGS